MKRRYCIRVIRVSFLEIKEFFMEIKFEKNVQRKKIHSSIEGILEVQELVPLEQEISWGLLCF